MRRFIIIALLCLVVTGLVAATVQVGNGAEVVEAPILPTIAFSISEVIYLNTELQGLAGGGLITHIAYQANNDINMADNTNNSWLIYIGETELSVFPGISAESWVQLDAMQEVYDGVVSTTNLQAGDWITIQLTNPYSYSGNNNLVIYVNEYADGYTGTSSSRFRGFITTAGYRTLRRNTANDRYEPKGLAGLATGSGGAQTNGVRPNIEFTYHTPTANPDLSITYFHTPTLLPDSADMLVTLTNLGNTTATPSDYDIEIYRVGSPDVSLYTIPSTATLAPASNGVYPSHTYHIEPSVYNSWTLGNAGESVILKAVVSYDIDTNPDNDDITTPSIALRAAESDIALVTTVPAIFSENIPLQIIVQNNGWAPYSAGSYEISLFENNSNTAFHIITATDELPLGASASYTITPSELTELETPIPGVFNLKIEVFTSSPDINSNNTASGSTFATPFGIEVDTDRPFTTNLVPFYMNYRDSVAQSIYRANELGGSPGLITHINYKITIVDVQGPPFPVNIYMANYYNPTFTGIHAWVPMNAFTLVADDIELPIQEGGTYNLWIELETPYFYTGDDLVVMTYKDHEFALGSNNVFFRSPTGNIALSRYKQTNAEDTNYDPENLLSGDAGTAQNYKPQIRFSMVQDGFGVISGHVIDESSDPIADVLVEIEGTNIKTTTDVTGYYCIASEVASTANIVFSKDRYVPRSYVINELGWSGVATGLDSVTLDLTLPTAIQITVTGTVTFADSQQPVAGVTVYFGALSGTTDASGEYTIADVYANEVYHVTIAISTEGYLSYSATVFTDYSQAVEDILTVNITIAEATRPPLYVTTRSTGEPDEVEINWFDPHDPPIITQFSHTTNPVVNVGISDGGNLIAAHRYTVAHLSQKGLVGSTLMKIAFIPYSVAPNNFIVKIWKGSDLSTPDVDNPTYTQLITQPLTAQQLNEIPLDVSILISADEELVIGIHTLGNYSISANNTSLSIGQGYANKYYSNDQWSTLNLYSQAPQASWIIYGYVAEPAEPIQPSRHFAEKYAVYRMPADQAIEQATMLTEATFTQDLSYVDTILTPGLYKYAVTSIYEGTGYSTPVQSAPTYTLPVTSRYYSFSGEVVYGDDEPFLGATITLTNTSGGASPQPFTCEGDNTFAFSVLPGLYNVSATGTLSGQTYAGGSTIDILGDINDHTITMSIVYREVSGVLQTDTDGSVVGITLSLQNQDEEGESPNSVTSEESGVFAFDEVLAGVYSLTLSRTTTTATYTHSELIEVTTADRDDIIVNVPYYLAIEAPVYAISGVVTYYIETEEEYLPLQDAIITLTNTDGDAFSPPAATTLEGGIYRIYTIEGEYDVSVTATIEGHEYGYISVEPYEVEDDADDKDISLLPIYTVAGTVMLNNALIPSVTVTFTNDDPTIYSPQPDTTSSDAEHIGEFSITAFAGLYNIEAKIAINGVNYEYISAEPYELTGDVNDMVIPLQLANAFTITGTVVSGTTPITNAVILVENVLGEVAYSPPAITVTDGTFTFQTIAGSYHITATAQQGGQYYTFATPEDEPLLVQGDIPTYEINMSVVYRIVGGVLQLDPSATGSVVDLTVSLVNDDENGSSPVDVISGEGGIFTFNEVLAGTYMLWVTGEETTTPYMHPEPIIVTNHDITDLEIELPPALSQDDLAIALIVTTLKSNYPNPFNPSTTIAFDIAREWQVSIDIYNIKGQRVKSLVNDTFGVGRYSIVWNGDDAYGHSVGSGVYFYRMTTSEYRSVRKMLLMK